ncbi:MAG: TolB family protein, partial [Anaerolineae bacterium]
VFSGRAYLLPAPSLVGTPQDEVGFQALYAGYTRRILHTFANQLASPLPLPRQDLMTLCFPPEGSEVHLFQYETAIDQWAELFPRRTFASISGLPDDGGVILQERFWGGDPTRLYLLRWQGGEETRLFDQAGGSWFYPPVGWTGMTAEPQLLVQGTAANQSNGLYHRLDWQNCDASGCTPTELSGFTVWSPNGRHTLVQIRSMLFFGDEAGRPLQELEKGFNPFWLNANSFAYIRYVNDESHQGMELVQTAVDAAQPPQRMIPEDADQPSFLFYAASNPANSNQIFIAAPDPDPRSSGYQIWELSANGSLTRRLTLDNKPFGYPSLLTPSGYPPFSFSPDGRYLVLTELAGEPVKSWQFYLVETATGATAVYDIPYPLYPARYPFYDWSADGRWLAIMDDGFVRLLAPDFDYERLITYDYDACFFVTWVNQ